MALGPKMTPVHTEELPTRTRHARAPSVMMATRRLTTRTPDIFTSASRIGSNKGLGGDDARLHPQEHNGH